MNFNPSHVFPLYHWPQPMKKKLNIAANMGFRSSPVNGVG